MRHRFSSLSGFVLTGGASLRMGRPKAMLILGRETMLERQLRLLSAVCRSVAVLGSRESCPSLRVPVFPDELPDRGPLGGIYTGLRRMRTEYGLFLGCDLPFVEVRFLEFLARRALDVPADVTVPVSHDRKLEPLCAVYGRRALWAVRASLHTGENKTRSFYPRVRCKVISWREIARAGFAPEIFVNMNTQEDYEVAKRKTLES